MKFYKMEGIFKTNEELSEEDKNKLILKIKLNTEVFNKAHNNSYILVYSLSFKGNSIKACGILMDDKEADNKFKEFFSCVGINVDIAYVEECPIGTFCSYTNLALYSYLCDGKAHYVNGNYTK